MNWHDFNDATASKPDLIPMGTIAKVRMSIKPGEYDDYERGWTDGYATRNPKTGSVYLACKFTVLDGEYIDRKVRSKIYLYSEKNEHWARIGYSFIKAILSSACGVSLYDNSARARHLRKINSLADLDGVEFLARIGVVLDKDNNERNAVNQAITCDHKCYAALMKSQTLQCPIKQLEGNLLNSERNHE